MMKPNRSTFYYLLIVSLFLLAVAINPAYGQNCSFTVDVSVIKQSDCEWNGEFQAVLKGSDVDNGYIQISDARYSIASIVPGGYSKTFDTNGGLLQGVPPGVYTITAEAFCTRTNSWVMFSSGQVTMPGTYPGFDVNQIMIETANMVASLKCSDTGVIPIRLGSGKKPYKVEIIEAPDSVLIGNTYTQTDEGVLYITDMPSGNYRFAISDDCGYMILLPTFLDVIDPVYKIVRVEDTPVCSDNGSIALSLKNGTLPYTISFTSTPPEYTGPDTIIVNKDYDDANPYIISNLPAGVYTYVVNDVCHPVTFTSEIKKVDPEVILTRQSGSVPCVAQGEIKFTLSGGLAPYTIKPINCPSTCPFDSITVSSAKDTIIGGLLPGYYEFSITDQCQNIILTEDVTIDTLKMKMSLASVKNVSSCLTDDGEAKITVIDGTAPYTSILQNLTTGTVIPPITGPPYNYTGLSAGDYQFKITDSCGTEDSVSFTLARDSLQARVVIVEDGIECKDIGEFYVEVIKGVPDFTLEILTGPKIEVIPPRSDTKFEFTDYPAGLYELLLYDACGDSIYLTAVIDTLRWNPLNMDLYEEFFYLPNPSDPNCEKLAVKRKTNGNTAFEKLWANRPELFEVAFLPNGQSLTPATQWRSILNTDTVSFPNKGYCEARTDGDYITTYVRFVSPALCDTIQDVIRFGSLYSNIQITNENCDGINLKVTHDKNNLICFDITIDIIDVIADTVKYTHNVGNLSDYTFTNIEHGSYTAKFTDSQGCEWMAPDTVVSVVPPPSAPKFGTPTTNCDDYSMPFTFQYRCYPFEWILVKTSDPGTVIDGRDIINAAADTTNGEFTLYGLEYSVEYQLCVISNQKRDTVCYKIIQTQTIPDNYKIDFTPSYCLPDTAKGYIRLYRSGSNNSFEKSSIIKYISGPTQPKHILDTIKTDGITEYFPFCADSLNRAADEWIDIEEGDYIFHIIDSCQRVHELKLEYKKSKVVGFEFDDDTYGCDGLNLKPKGSIYLGNTKITSYFRIITTPDGVADINTVVTEGGYLNLKETGRYTLQISQQSGINSCPFDTLTIDYVKQTLSLESDSTRTYVCDENSDGYIRVLRKGGVGPFTYELFDNGTSIEKNNTGIFWYGQYGGQYTVRITDMGCGVSFPVDVYMLNLSNERLINDDIKICLGDDIRLQCISVGSYIGYNWTGPNGFTINDQNPVIPNASTDMNGKYQIEVQPEGCSQPIVQAVDVDVVDPVPLVDTTLVFCINDNSDLIDIIPTVGNNIRWYKLADNKTDTVMISSAPKPATNKPDTVDYYVSQVNAMLGCEGIKSRVRVITQAFPDTVAYAFTHDICRDNCPLITIPETYDGYTYRLYSQNNNKIGEAVATGDTLIIPSTDGFYNSGLLYIEVETKHRCVSQEKSKVPVNVVHASPPVPYDIIYCLGDTPVPLQADSLDGNRLQWYSSDSIAIMGAPLPPTDVVGELIYYVAQVDTLLGCEGDWAELKVTVVDLPTKIPDIAAAPICPDASPTIVIPQGLNNYTYNVYTALNGGEFLTGRKGTGGQLEIQLDTALTVSTHFYVEVINNNDCTGLERTTVPVVVVDPPVKPQADTVNIVCLFSKADPLRAEALPGHYLQWFDTDGITPLPSAPVPSTDKVDTITYYVSQLSSDLHCESEKQPVVAVVSDLPGIINQASSPVICPGMYPVIYVPQSYDNYVYQVYTRKNGGTLVGEMIGTGERLEITTIEPVFTTTNYYVEVINDNQCSGLERTSIDITVDNYLYIRPDTIPPYERGKPYYTQLLTNAAAPYEFTALTSLPLGFQLSVLGEISGTAPVNGKIDPSPFRVQVIDNDGCIAIKEYELVSDLFVPQVFTPNGDGSNDHFMRGKRLIIFDRLGIKIFEGTDGWDGTRDNGKPAPADTYFYVIFHTDYTGMEVNKTGYITLLRRR